MIAVETPQKHILRNDQRVESASRRLSGTTKCVLWGTQNWNWIKKRYLKRMRSCMFWSVTYPHVFQDKSSYSNNVLATLLHTIPRIQFWMNQIIVCFSSYGFKVGMCNSDQVIECSAVTAMIDHENDDRGGKNPRLVIAALFAAPWALIV